MRKVFLKLSDEQIKEGVVFTSTLSRCKVEEERDTVHKVMKDDTHLWDKIERLKNDRYFNANTCGWRYNVIRTISGNDYNGGRIE